VQHERNDHRVYNEKFDLNDLSEKQEQFDHNEQQGRLDLKEFKVFNENKEYNE
jgi:hypothetical protein